MRKRILLIGVISVLLVLSLTAGVSAASEVCNDNIIPNCDFNNMDSPNVWIKEGAFQNTNEVGVTSSWWGPSPYCGSNKGWWTDASVHQTITLPANAKTLQWNVGTELWYSTDGVTPTGPQDDQGNARVSVLINGNYLANHYDPPVGGGTLTWDISQYAGQTVDLKLVIEGDCNEWAQIYSNWVDIGLEKCITFGACVDGSDWITVNNGQLSMVHDEWSAIGTTDATDCPSLWYHRINLDTVDHTINEPGKGVSYIIDGQGSIPVGIAALTSFTKTDGRGGVSWDGTNKIYIDDNGPKGGDEYHITLCGQPALPHNSPPVVTVDTSFSGSEGVPVTFAVTASDSDGDTLTYCWDFNGDASCECTTSTCQYTYPNDGENTATLTVSDGTDPVTKTIPVSIANTVPTVNAGSDGVIAEGETFTSSGSFTDLGTDSWSATVDYGDGTGSQPLALNPDKTFALSHIYANDGIFTVTVTINDGTGSGSDTASVTVDNVAPSVTTFTADKTVAKEGETVKFTLVFTDPGADTWSLLVDYHDGSAPETLPVSSKTFEFTHTFIDDSTGASITISDGDGGSADASCSVKVENVAPIVTTNINPPAIDEGSTFTSSGSFTDPGTDSWTATVDYGDGSGPQSLALNSDKTFTLSHVYSNNGEYTVKVEIADDDGGIGSVEFKITVNNVAPVVNAGADATINEGSTFTSSGSFTDPGADTWTATVDYGDGSGVQVLPLTGKTFSLSHVYADNAVTPYRVTVTVTDKDSGVGSDTAAVTVNNVAPTSSVSNNGPKNEGSAVTVSFGAVTDPGTLDKFKYSFDWNNDGTYEVVDQVASSADHTWYDNGVFTVKAKVSDKDSGFTEYTTAVTVNNVAPTVTITGPKTWVIPVGSVTFAGSFTDPGTADTHTATWYFDDVPSNGIVTETPGSGIGTASFTKTFATGVYNVKLTITDDDGGVGTATQYNGVDAILVIYDPNGGFVTGGGWIISPAGAYKADPTMTGKANFGFVSKYKKGATVPDGETEFQFQAGNLNFHSNTYEWLVISGQKATYKGVGTINGAGNYAFVLSAIDGPQDKFRIKIWENNQGKGVVYDNLLKTNAVDDEDPTTLLGGGNIVIHK